MPYSYLLSLLLLFPFLLSAQSVRKSTVSLGLSRTSMYLHTTDFHEVYDLHGRGATVYTNRNIGHGPDLSLGFGHRMRPRWTLQVQANFTRRALRDPIAEEIYVSNENFLYTRPRTYRVFRGEALLFYHFTGSIRTLDLRLGTGIARAVYHQEYQSGYRFDLDAGIYEVFYTTQSRESSWGLPLHLELHYPWHERWSVGTRASYTRFPFGNRQLGFGFAITYAL